MKLAFDAETEAFRAEFGEWIEANSPDPSTIDVPSKSSADAPPWARAWQRKLFDAGWLVPGNPPEYGGRNATLIQQFVVQEELHRRRIDVTQNPQGLSIIAPSLLNFGTEEQKQKWAVPLLRADVTADLGMSEPDAVSDLAGLRTRAVLDGDHFVVNGQKVWTSGAHDADFILAFVRTDPDVPKHKGISVILVPTESDGLVRRPFPTVCHHDDLDFNEVFFTDVRVPAENLVGPLNGGWRVANGALGHERTMMWMQYADRLHNLVEDFRPATALERDKYATLLMDRQALRLLGSAAVAKASRGEEDMTTISVLKVLGSEAERDATEAALDAMGVEGLRHPANTSAYAPYDLDYLSASWIERYFRSFAGTIAGGTSEIQRNIIARGLGLPMS